MLPAKDVLLPNDKSRVWTRWIAAGLIAGGLCCTGLSGCGPEPVGVDDCRAIESARCTAGVACGIVEDEEACKRFYRDHCLHGLAASETPGGKAVDDCVQAIQIAGECAKQDPDASIPSCLDGDKGINVVDRDVETVCDVVREPEGTKQCAFLTPIDPGAAGAAGAAGD